MCVFNYATMANIFQTSSFVVRDTTTLVFNSVTGAPVDVSGCTEISCTHANVCGGVCVCVVCVYVCGGVPMCVGAMCMCVDLCEFFIGPSILIFKYMYLMCMHV